MKRSEHTKIETVAALVEARHEEYLRQFAGLNIKLDTVSSDVKSLLASRSVIHGAWKAVTIISGAVAAVVALGIKALEP